MSTDMSPFQERLALIIGAATLIGLGASKRRPMWGGMALIALAGLMAPVGVKWLSSRTASFRYDKVTESPEESLPASDPPSWTTATI
jgi:hypothetical protein